MRRIGHIRERSPGAFEIRYSFGSDPATGKRKIATATVRGTRKSASCAGCSARSTPASKLDSNRLTVRDWLATWLATIRTEVAPRTHERYTEIVNDRLAPAFGNLQLTRFAPAHIQTVYTEWATAGRRDGKAGPLAPQSRRLIHRVLNAALTRAVELQLIARNPAQVLKRHLPKDERREMATLTPEEAKQLLDAIRSTPLYWPVLIALATGARRGEVVALRWRNVDLNHGSVRIVESLERTKAGLRFKPPKSGKARVVTLPAFAVEELRRRRIEQAEELLRLGEGFRADNLVCAQPDGAPISPNVLTNYFSRIAKRFGLAVHFHSLRHTHATQLLLAGVHPKVAQERLGHATVAMTLDIYSHVTERLRDDAAAKIDAVFKGTR